MGETSISWTERTWNPLTGCTQATAGCDNCYAMTLHTMRHRLYMDHNGHYPYSDTPIPAQYAKPFSEIQLFPERLNDPLKIKKPTRFFVNSMSDLFHSRVPEEYIQQVFDVMKRAHWHTFQILTKRAGRLRLVAPRLDWAPNIWMGVSIELDNLTPRADALRTVPAAVRFLSCEPLLGQLPSLNLEGIHWLIAGGESGVGARPCKRDWVRDLRDRCQNEGVAFHFKQWGGRRPDSNGRVLDGRTWDEFPEAVGRVA